MGAVGNTKERQTQISKCYVHKTDERQLKLILGEPSLKLELWIGKDSDVSGTVLYQELAPLLLSRENILDSWIVIRPHSK
jgi:hypothetical protein